MSRRRQSWPWLLAVLPLVGACGPDVGQVAICTRALTTLTSGSGATVIASRDEADPAGRAGTTHAITLTYRTAADPLEKTVTCRFAGGRFNPRDRLYLVGLRIDDSGELSALPLAVLRRRARLPRIR